MAVAVTEDYTQYLQFVYELAISKGYEPLQATNLSEMALFKIMYEGIKYTKQYETQLNKLLSGKHH
jgi:hypothetical protein